MERTGIEKYLLLLLSSMSPWTEREGRDRIGADKIEGKRRYEGVIHYCSGTLPCKHDDVASFLFVEDTAIYL